jgi:methyl-accepting chemotaxis protein
MKEVASYNQAEATAEKEPKVFQEFTYDNDSNGGVLNKFEEINSKIQEIKGIIQDLGGNYNDLVNKYEAFTNYADTMKGIVNSMNQNADAIQSNYKGVVDTAKQAVDEHMKVDSSLMTDLDELNRLLGTGTN